MKKLVGGTAVLAGFAALVIAATALATNGSGISTSTLPPGRFGEIDVKTKNALPHQTSVYVDCAAAPGGDGGKKAPLATITAALPIARALAAAGRVTIDVAPGICDDEVFPIELDFPVVVRGSRSPEVDEEGLPLNGQDHDTLVTWVPPSPVPPSVAALAFFRITGSDVRISKLSLDGKIVPGTVGAFAPAATAPIGVLAHNAKDGRAPLRFPARGPPANRSERWSKATTPSPATPTPDRAAPSPCVSAPSWPALRSWRGASMRASRATGSVGVPGTRSSSTLGKPSGVPTAGDIRASWT